MERQSKDTFITRCLQTCDALLVFVAFCLALNCRPLVLKYYNEFVHSFAAEVFVQGINDISAISTTLLVIIPFSPVALQFFGFYRNAWTISFWKSFLIIIGAIFLVICWFSLCNTFLKFEQSSRALLIIASIFMLILLLLRHALWRSYFLRKVGRNEIKESVLIAGDSQSLVDIERLLKLDKTTSWKVVGSHDLISPNWETFQHQLHDESVARVIIAAQNVKFQDIAVAVEMCEIRGIEAWISAQFMQTQLARPSFDTIHGSPMLVLRSTPEFCWELLVKDIIDRSVALLFIIFTLPLWILVAIGIKLQSPGPVFFMQTRAGKYGKPFRMWKFRSMQVGAENQQDEVRAKLGNLMSGPVFKVDNDPRVFPFGHILRKFSIDEFPQMINVLKGDMSLVGPRPMSIQLIPNIERSEHRRKLSVKPGITCIWQVRGRNSITSFDEWVRLDLEYIDEWSLWLDIKLLFQTIPAVIFARGAK